MFKRMWGFLPVLCVLPSLAAIETQHAQVRLMPPSVPNTAGYLQLTSTEHDDALLGAQCEGVKKTELHTLLHEDGLMKMRAISHVSLPKNQQVALEQGGHHLMLMGLERPLQQGQQLHCELSFKQAQPVSVAFTVTPIGASADHHHHH